MRDSVSGKKNIFNAEYRIDLVTTKRLSKVCVSASEGPFFEDERSCGSKESDKPENNVTRSQSFRQLQ